MSLPATEVAASPRDPGGLGISERWAPLRRWERPLRHGTILASVVWVVVIALGWFELGTDAWAYWLSRSVPWYEADYGGVSTFNYSPAFGQVLAPFVMLPWPLFAAGWAGLMLASLFALGGRWGWALLFLPPVAFELYAGNVHLLLAIAIVVGFRYPAAWAFVLLTKVTPGVGLLWFAARREWHRLVMALGVTAVIVAVSFALDPDAWSRWIAYLVSAPGISIGYPHLPVPLIVRLPISAAIVVWGALTDRRWTVPVAAMLALPVIWPGSLAMLLAILPLSRRTTA